jgi:hypothetical protein
MTDTPGRERIPLVNQDRGWNGTLQYQWLAVNEDVVCSGSALIMVNR